MKPKALITRPKPSGKNIKRAENKVKASKTPPFKVVLPSSEEETN
jgi:hypothetical protein